MVNTTLRPLYHPVLIVFYFVVRKDDDDATFLTLQQVLHRMTTVFAPNLTPQMLVSPRNTFHSAGSFIPYKIL
jgi:hypothetical protein